MGRRVEEDCLMARLSFSVVFFFSFSVQRFPCFSFCVLL